MPLTAHNPDGAVIDATDVTPQEWAPVYKTSPRAVLACRNCRAPMHAKVSSRGLRFFAHDRHRPDCPSAGETAEHRWLKSQLAAAVRAAGWDAVVEAEPGAGDAGGWRADVLATSPDGKERVALEAQLAAMTVAEGQARTERYGRDGMTTVWVTTKNAPWLWQLWGCKVDALDDAVDPPVATRGCIKYDNAERRWIHVPVPLARLVGVILTRRVVALDLAYLAETVTRAGRTLELTHRRATAIVPAAHAAAEHQRRRQLRVEAARYEADQQRREKNIEALYRRQEALLPLAIEDARDTGKPVWVGVPPDSAPTPDEVTLDNAAGNEKTAMGAVVWVGETRDALRLFAVLSPVASHISPGLAASWRQRGVRVYVAEDREAARVAGALGWPTSRLRLMAASPSADEPAASITPAIPTVTP